jgi:hypothetical protein
MCEFQWWSGSERTSLQRVHSSHEEVLPRVHSKNEEKRSIRFHDSLREM